MKRQREPLKVHTFGARASNMVVSGVCLVK